MPFVKLRELQPGDVLATDVLDYAGRLLVSSATVLTADHIHKLARRNVDNIEIMERRGAAAPAQVPSVEEYEEETKVRPEDGTFQASDPGVSRDVLRRILSEQSEIFSTDVVASVKPEMLRSLPQSHPDSLLNRAGVIPLISDGLALKAARFYDTLCAEMPYNGWTFDYRSVRTIVDEMLGEVFSRKDPIVKLRFNTTHPRRYNAFHAINTCLLGALLAEKMDFSGDEVGTIARGLFLHDIGKTTIPDENIARSVSLSDRELSMARKHPQAGYLVLQGNPDIEFEVLLLAREHHERYDGSGYPSSLTGENISRQGRLAAIIDVFDAMTFDRPYRRKSPKRDALQEILNHINVDFDPEMTRQFISVIGYYPVGSVVELNDHSLAVVLRQAGGGLMRPVLKVLYDANNDRAIDELIDLSQIPQLNITRCLA